MSSPNRDNPDQRPADEMNADRSADERGEHGPNPGKRGKWLSALVALLGLWMIVQAFGVDLTASQFWNDILVGALLLVVGGYNYSRRSDERFANTAAALVAAVAGLWLIAAPFLLGTEAGLTETANDFGFWNDVVVGLLALGLGAYSAYRARDHRRDARRTAA